MTVNPSDLTAAQSSAGAVPVWDLSDRMRKCLSHSGIGVSEIADYFGVSRNTVSSWINGRVVPTVQTMRLWSLKTGVDYDWLKTGKAPHPEEDEGPKNGLCAIRDSNPEPAD